MDLNLVQLVFEVEADDAKTMTAGLHRAVRRFDLLFRQSCCRYGARPCLGCKDQAACPYWAVFAQELSTDPEIVRRHQKPPLPFAFKIRHISANNSCLDVSLVVVGSAINHVSVFCNALQRLIESCSDHCLGTLPTTTGIYCLDYQRVRHKLDSMPHDTQNLVVLSSLEILKNTSEDGNVRLVLESPLRLLSAGSIVHAFDFDVFMRAQLRRCSSLFAYYGDGELEVDYVAISQNAKKVVCSKDGISYSLPDWSNRANQAGLLGISEFKGLAKGMLPLLALGSCFNSGKGASFGSGVYRIDAISSDLV